MTYVSPNLKTKKALREAVAAGNRITVYEPGLGTAPVNGAAYIEGPHYPEPHRWYAQVEVTDGVVTRVVS
jgi:hypothetical protein